MKAEKDVGVVAVVLGDDVASARRVPGEADAVAFVVAYEAALRSPPMMVATIPHPKGTSGSRAAEMVEVRKGVVAVVLGDAVVAASVAAVQANLVVSGREEAVVETSRAVVLP